MDSGSLNIKTRKYQGFNESSTIVLELNKINTLKKFVDKYNNSDLFKFYTKKIIRF